MDEYEEINLYDLVEIIYVPEQYKGVIGIGDIGVVIKKYDEENFEVECIQPGASYKWLATLNIGYLRLRSRDPYDSWMKRSLAEQPLMRKSILLGMTIGAGFGAFIGAGLGAITLTLNGIVIGLIIGLVSGAVTGALTAAVTVKTAGTTGGIGVGYFTGMLFGGIFGILIGALFPTSLRMSIHTEGLPMLDALMLSRFETATLLGFLLSVLGAIVGTWIAGINLIPRNLNERYRP
jgi:hypothetical protein